MIWDNKEYKIELGSLNIEYESDKETRHYPYTDRSVDIDRGNKATRISCTLLAKSLAEYEELLILPFIESRANLELKTYFFRNVKTGGTNSFTPIGFLGGNWRVSAEFVALDPKPYNIDTGEPVVT